VEGVNGERGKNGGRKDRRGKKKASGGVFHDDGKLFQSEHVLDRPRAMAPVLLPVGWPSLPGSIVLHELWVEEGLAGDVVRDGVTIAENFRLERQMQVRQDPFCDVALGDRRDECHSTVASRAL